MKTIKFLATVVVSTVVAFVVALLVDVMEWLPYRYTFVVTYVSVALGVAALLGAFTELVGKRTKHTSIKDAARYQQAA